MSDPSREYSLPEASQQSTSTSSAVKASHPHLCSYSDSSSDESHDGCSPVASKSPRKKRRGEDTAKRPSVAYLNKEGLLDVELLFSEEEFDPFEALDEHLERLLPGFKDLDVEEKIKPQEKEVTGNLGAQEKPKELEEQCEGAPRAEDFRKPKLRNRKFIFKPFIRSEDGRLEHNESAQPVDVVVPEQLAASYGLYIWPSSPVLSWYIWLHQADFVGKRVLELGAGTSLPGLLCAKIGAEKVYLADIATDPEVLSNCKEAIKLNKLQDRVDVVGISWGSFDPDIFRFEDNLDFIVGSDLFFDPEVFDRLCLTLSYLIDKNPRAKVFVTVQVRSEDWSVEEHFIKWNLRGRLIFPHEFLQGTGLDEGDLTGKHTIFILEISRNQA